MSFCQIDMDQKIMPDEKKNQYVKNIANIYQMIFHRVILIILKRRKGNSLHIMKLQSCYRKHQTGNLAEFN
jgi:hypothetical protein